jgi:Tol biopolymer transport system component
VGDDVTRADTRNRLCRRSAFAAFALGALVAAMAAAAAPRTVPGKNGRIVFAATTGRFSQLFTVEPDGSGLKQVTHLVDSDALNANWSPDGKRIVFERDFPYGHAGIYSVEADGGAVRSLTPNKKKRYFEGVPAYSPNGKKVVYVREICVSDRNCHNAMWTKSANGGGARRMTPVLASGTGGYLAHPQFSPDGKRIVYAKKIGDRAAVFVINSNGRRARQLTKFSMGVDNRVDWSPNGRLILFSDNFRGPDIWTVHPNGTRLKRIYRAIDGNYSADSWSPDGKQIVLVRGAGGTTALCVMNAHGTGLRQITHGLNVLDDGGSWGTHP